MTPNWPRKHLNYNNNEHKNQWESNLSLFTDYILSKCFFFHLKITRSFISSIYLRNKYHRIWLYSNVCIIELNPMNFHKVSDMFMAFWWDRLTLFQFAVCECLILNFTRGHLFVHFIRMQTFSVRETIARACNWKNGNRKKGTFNYFVYYFFEISISILRRWLTSSGTVWTFEWSFAGVLIYVEFQVLVSFEHFVANSAFVGPAIAMWYFMLL